MLNWWNSLDALQHFFAYVAIPATLILCIQTILLLFGLGAGGDGDLDSDTSGLDTGDGTAPDLDAPDLDTPDTDVPDSWDGEGGHALEPDPGLRIFTIRGLVAFFSVFGWAGLALSRSGMSGGLSTLIAFLLGLGSAGPDAAGRPASAIRRHHGPEKRPWPLRHRLSHRAAPPPGHRKNHIGAPGPAGGI